MSSRWKAASLAALVAASLSPSPALAQTTGKKPNILVLFGDDIGFWNVSAYNRGMMGYRTPNIDRIAKEGAIFTDAYAQQSCTAGRAAFITGQSPVRTGLLKVGLPGAPEGLSGGTRPWRCSFPGGSPSRSSSSGSAGASPSICSRSCSAAS